MLKIMKKSMLLVIFSFALTFFATSVFGAVQDVTNDGLNPPDNEEFVVGVFAAPNGDEDDNEGDPDGYKEGWDTDVLQNSPSGINGLNTIWGPLFNMWMILSSQGPF